MSKSKRLISEGAQTKIGVLFSYSLIILNTLYGLLITPYLISSLGDGEYGVYKTISSFTAALMVLDLGIGSTVMRYISQYRATRKEEKIPNFLAMMLIQAVSLCALVFAVGLFAFGLIDPLYSNTFNAAELSKAKALFIVLLANVLLHILSNVLNGAVTGSNRFVFGNGIKIIRLLLRILLIVGLLPFFQNSLVIVLVDCCLTLCFLIFEFVYIRCSLKIKIKLVKWEKQLFWESGKYTFLMFLTTIAAQVNNNLDNVIIGAMSGPQFVTVYSMGLLIFAMYEQLSTSISGVMLPTVSKILQEDCGMAKVQNLIVSAGRIQFVLLGAAVVGFACIGQDFITLWLGDGFQDVYMITLILMIPSLFELCVNVCLSVLRAKNMLGFRTVVLFGSTVLNLVVTIIAIHTWSYIGAAFGTAASFMVGSLLIMNIYYHKKFNLPILKIYGRIVDRIWLCLAVSGAVLFVASKFINGGWIAFVLNVLIFCVVYAACLLAFGLCKEEKSHIPFFRRFIKNI